MKALTSILALVAVVAIQALIPAAAEETEITVRVISKGAKYVGTSMGGAEIIIRDAETGEELARGLTAGGTGDTLRIMGFDAARAGAFGASNGEDAAAVMARRGSADTRATEGSAAFMATIDIDKATFVEIAATGPENNIRARQRVTHTQWLLPGRHITMGEAITLELPGFVVNIETLAAGIELSGGGRSLDIKAKVTMMCGCPTQPGGIWDSDGYRIVAEIFLDDVRVAEVPLVFTGDASTFAGRTELPGSGAYRVQVTAFDPRNGNTGLDRAVLEIAE